MAITNTNYDLMKKSLDALWLRQKVTSNNIANIDTPGFKASIIEFENILKEILDSGEKKKTIDEKVLEIESLEIEDGSAPIREDGNNVNLDAQNIEMVRTQLQYQYMSRMISDEFSREKYSINEGRR